MFLRKQQKFLSSLLLVPVAALFLVCCCLKVEASPSKKSSCASCPQKERSTHQTDCPHAKIKAIVDATSFELNITKTSFVVADLINPQRLVFFRFIRQLSLYQLDTSQDHFSLCKQNPILRV